MSANPTPTLYHALVRERNEMQSGFYAFLSCVKKPESPASVILEQGFLKRIHEFTVPLQLSERACNYKVKLDMCSGTEHVFVEALYLKGGWENDNNPPGATEREVYTQEWCGSLSSRTIGGAGFFLERWIPQVAFLTNGDGSYHTEGQLRRHFASFMRNEFCSSSRRCGGKCIALPGDTIYWKFREPYRVVTRWESATDEELEERGWLHGGGLLYQYCQLFRDDPSALDEE